MSKTQRISGLPSLLVMAALVTLVFGSLHTAYAQDGQHAPTLFFTALSDIPAMNGLIELEDYTLVFDKPEGRIIEMVARLEGQTIASVRSYYRSALPEMGWRRVSEDRYARGSEDMIFAFETRDGQSYARITVQPH